MHHSAHISENRSKRRAHAKSENSYEKQNPLNHEILPNVCGNGAAADKMFREQVNWSDQ